MHKPLLSLQALSLIVIIAAFLGGVSRDIGQTFLSLTGHEIDSSLSLIQWFVFGLGLFSWLKTMHAEKQLHTASAHEYLLLAVLAVILLVPVAIVSWFILVIISAYLLMRYQFRAYRCSLVILLALSLNEVMNFFLIKFMTMPVLELDAMFTAGLLWLLTSAGDYEGNIVVGAAGHQLMILRGCSSLSNLSLGLLLWFSVSRYLQLHFGHRDVMHLVALGAAIILINVVRLLWMAIDIDMHAWFHRGIGEFAYQAVFSIVLLGFIRWRLHHA